MPKPDGATVRIASRAEVSQLPRWSRAFAGERKDHRFYELVEDTLTDGFSYRYLVVESRGDIRAIQPSFVVDQDLLGGISGFPKRCFDIMRRVWPRFMRARTLMIGCSAGEGHLDARDMPHAALAEALAGALPGLARELDCVMVVLKEFPAHYRTALSCLGAARFTRIPSMPLTKLALPYKNFDDYVRSKLSATTRATLRRKLRVCARAQPPVTLEVMHDARGIIDEIHPLYLNVFARSPLQFEKLTREFLAEIGARIPDKTRFFVWRQNGRVVAFALCLVDDDDIYYEYVGSTMRSPLSCTSIIGCSRTSSNGRSQTATASSTAAASTTIRNGTCGNRSLRSTFTCATSRHRSTRCSGACCR